MEGIGRVVIGSVIGGLFGATTFFAVDALTAKPSDASVYAVQQKDGTWKVSKYDDGDPTISITSRDMSKTIKVDGQKLVTDYSKKIYTDTGKLMLTSYEQADEAWMQTPLEMHRGPADVTPPLAYCGSGGCNYPTPGTFGRPAKPQLKKGLHFNYGTKKVSTKVDSPNPNYLQLEDPDISFSERAKKPGGRWIVGTTIQMPRGEFWEYMRYLERN